MAYDPTIPALNNYIGDDIPKIMANFAELAGSRIVEMGSNSNGTYVRWENGLQVCFAKTNLSPSWTQASGGWGYHSGPHTISQPATFVSNPFATISMSDIHVGARSSWCSFVNATVSGIEVW